MRERWRPVVGFEGSYEVSSAGRVRSLDRIVSHSNGEGQRRLHGKILSPGLSRVPGLASDGYWTVILCPPRTTRHVHRLVAEAFLGERPSPLHGVNHRDGDGTNNSIANLEWATRSGNMIHAAMIGNRGKVSPDDVIEIRRRCESGEPQRVLASEFGVDQTSISAIHRRKTWEYV